MNQTTTETLPQVPLPSLAQESAQPTQFDREFAAQLADRLAKAGMGLSDHALDEVLQAAMGWRVQKLDEIGAVYASVCLFASNLVSLIHSMRRASTPHPHGSEPRMLVFAEEFDAVVNSVPSAFSAPAVAEAARLTGELRKLQSARRDADSAYAVLKRISAEISVALSTPELTRFVEVSEAAERSRDLAQVELKSLADTKGACPTESELGSCYFPVRPSDPSGVMTGDVLYDPQAKHVVYEHGSPRHAVDTPEAGASSALLELAKGRTVLLRPIGVQAVLALRFRITTLRLLTLMKEEKALASKAKSGALHEGRSQAFAVAHELLTVPSWGLPAMGSAKAAVDKVDEAKTSG